MELFDSHAHYNDEKFNNDREKIIEEIYNSGVTKLICAGYNVQSSIKAQEIANKHDFIYTTAGISPNDLPEDYQDENLTDKSANEREMLYTESLKIVDTQLHEIEKIAQNNKVVAIGEIGLDYYWNK